ncbi:DUF1987 domain-containing protein [Petroclostridium sp. X23]|uniref:DUF1987 domain-containing protein n=1 Tax=Petroclostridium sp. X23 TaxID=3045146 RepID=UPI0024ACC3A9|nr:DUF1987 domain-containing protein [Petroclostridium sp. X23]WHH58518.1 DUF1987 domain-containing protein [Petroclostridium sp. X23]
MDKLYIEQTKGTPQVDFNPDTGILILKGQSYPENAFKFYEPIFKWTEEFLEQVHGQITIEIDFSLPYINSSSSKCIMMLLDKFEDAFNEGKKVTINWYYDEDNESSFECAEEFKEDLTLPFYILKADHAG